MDSRRLADRLFLSSLSISPVPVSIEGRRIFRTKFTSRQAHSSAPASLFGSPNRVPGDSAPSLCSQCAEQVEKARGVVAHKAPPCLLHPFYNSRARSKHIDSCSAATVICARAARGEQNHQQARSHPPAACLAWLAGGRLISKLRPARDVVAVPGDSRKTGTSH